MKLRYYQKEAIKAILRSIASSTDAVAAVVPTGGGKTPIIANLCKTFNNSGYRTLILAHRAELLQQAVDKIRVWAPEIAPTVFSAGLRERDPSGSVVVAGIQSVYDKITKIVAHGAIDCVIVDEAHLIPESGDGMYRSALADLKRANSSVSVVGLTATPYRMASGAIVGDGKIFRRIVYDVSVGELIEGGYLSKLISKAPPTDANFDAISIKRGEFDRAAVETICAGTTAAAARDVVRYARERNSVLIFCSSVATARAAADQIAAVTGDRDAVATIFGDTPRAERDEIIRRFSRKSLRRNIFGETEKAVKFLINVDVLTTGFDVPCVDCVALLRPTASPGLYYQMIGRGLRLDDEKENCLILDFGGNLRRFGPIDKLEQSQKISRKNEPKSKICPRCFSALDPKVLCCNNCKFEFEPPNIDFLCPACGAQNSRIAKFCVSCGFEIPRVASERGERLDETADFSHAVLSSEERQIIYDGIQKTPIFEEKIEKIFYSKHVGKSGTPCLRVGYVARSGAKINDFVCLEHRGGVRQTAARWWIERSDVRPIPDSVDEALDAIESGGIAEPAVVRYRPADATATDRRRFPTLVSAPVDAPKPAPNRELANQNPLNLSCENCGAARFRYERDGDRYRAFCRDCGAVVWEMSPLTYDDKMLYDDDVEELKRLNIRFKPKDVVIYG